MNKHFCIRLTKIEKSNITRLAKDFNLSITEYIKFKIFEDNHDILENEPKYITPDKSKHFYFMAMSQIKLLYLFQRLFEKQNVMTENEFTKFEKELTTKCRQAIERFGYQKLETPKHE